MSVPNTITLDPKILKCPLCSGVLTCPVDTSCSHTFCHSCIVTARKTSDTCPICRANITDLRPNNKVREIITNSYPDIKHTYEKHTELMIANPPGIAPLVRILLGPSHLYNAKRLDTIREAELIMCARQILSSEIREAGITAFRYIVPTNICNSITELSVAIHNNWLRMRDIGLSITHRRSSELNNLPTDDTHAITLLNTLRSEHTEAINISEMISDNCRLITNTCALQTVRLQ
jgi:hypothetical protein